MKIAIIVEYPEIENPNSNEADEVIGEVTKITEHLAGMLGIDSENCYVDNAFCEKIKKSKNKGDTIGDVKKEKFFFEASDEHPLNDAQLVKDFLSSIYERGTIFKEDEIIKHGTYRCCGWVYDFRPYLKRYYYEPGDTVAYVPNKKILRRLFSGQKVNILEKS